MTSSVCNPSAVIEVHESTHIVYYGVLIGGLAHPFGSPERAAILFKLFFFCANLYLGLIEGERYSIVSHFESKGNFVFHVTTMVPATILENMMFLTL